MSESRTGEWPVAIFDVRLSLQLEAKDFTSVDEEPLNLVASTWRLSMRSIWPLPVTKTQGSSTQRPQGVKSFWLMVLVGRPVLTTPPVVYSIMFCVPGCWTDLSRRNARLAANPLALYAFREYEWGIWYLAWRTHRHSFAHHFTSASWDGRKPINLPQMPRIYSNVRKRKKNQRRQKGMKESCTSGLLGCQDISSFTGICCCCCLASLYRVMEIPNVAVVVGRVCLASTGLMDQPSHVKNASFLPTTDYTPTLLIIRAWMSLRWPVVIRFFWRAGQLANETPFLINSFCRNPFWR